MQQRPASRPEWCRHTLKYDAAFLSNAGLLSAARGAFGLLLTDTGNPAETGVPVCRSGKGEMIRVAVKLARVIAEIIEFGQVGLCRGPWQWTMS